MKSKKVLTVNAGSSGIKFALFNAGEQITKELYGKIDSLNNSETALTYHDLVKNKTGDEVIGKTPAVKFLVDWLHDTIDISSLAGLGHRVVYGIDYHEPRQVSRLLLDELRNVASYDPNHLPQQIEMMEMFSKNHPGLLQLACFDTAFHAEMPRIAKLLPLPARYDARHIRRYGFHGLSYAYLMEELAHIAGKEEANGKIILAHLGNGASLAAVREGKSMDTSMGFTPASGLVMGSRTGDLDPGVAWYIMQSENLNATQFNDLINKQSGLLGISETSSDMQYLLKHQHNDKRAADAVELFCYQAKKWIGSFAAVLEGINTLVFAGGIGENAPEIRSRICTGLKFLGIELDEKRNIDNNEIISIAKASVTVRVIQTNEELMIAKSVCKVLKA